jgi:hypothetical protein
MSYIRLSDLLTNGDKHSERGQVQASPGRISMWSTTVSRVRKLADIVEAVNESEGGHGKNIIKQESGER